MITWDSQTLYDPPTVGVCEISGKFETGRFFRRNGKRIFIGDSAQSEAVDDYVEFLTALKQVTAFKRGYPKREWTAASVEPPKKKKKR